MNWGYRILLVYLTFVAGIVFLVFKSSSQKVELVTTDYYAKELKYQQNIDENKRTSALSAPVKCEVSNHNVSIHFPKEFDGKKISGQLVLYCPSDETKDYQLPFDTENGLLSVDLPAANKGANQLQIRWHSETFSYYFEKRIIL